MSSVIAETVNIVHTNIGSRPSVIPGARIVAMVAIKLIAVAIVPKPVMSTERFQ